MSKVKVINRISGKTHEITANELEAWQNAGIPVKVVEYPKPDIIKDNKPKDGKE